MVGHVRRLGGIGTSSSSTPSTRRSSISGRRRSGTSSKRWRGTYSRPRSSWGRTSAPRSEGLSKRDEALDLFVAAAHVGAVTHCVVEQRVRSHLAVSHRACPLLGRLEQRAAIALLSD